MRAPAATDGSMVNRGMRPRGAKAAVLVVLALALEPCCTCVDPKRPLHHVHVVDAPAAAVRTSAGGWAAGRVGRIVGDWIGGSSMKTEDEEAPSPRGEVNLLRELRGGATTPSCEMAPCVADGSCAVLTDYGPGGHPMNEHIGAQGTGHGTGVGENCDPRPERNAAGAAWCVQGGPNGVRVCGAASSSTVGWGGEPGFALDGNTDGSFDAGSCSHTDNPRGAPAWWQVDLGRASAVQRVVIHHRTDCCQGRMAGALVLVGRSAEAFGDAAQCGVIRDER